MTRNLSILGSTGSIGTQTLEILSACGIHAAALTTNRNYGLLEQQARALHPTLVAAYDEEAARSLKILLADTDIRVEAGMDGLLSAATLPEADTVLTAVVGMVGLLPTLAAIAARKNIALANKETLVCGGQLVMQAARRQGVRILPVDSEHSAIFQCLQARGDNEVAKLILTASGGPFFRYSADQLHKVTRTDALRHPNWSMGAKITVDSATMVNKGLELIEAMWLFDIEPEQIEIVVHRESILHSAVEFSDGAVVAQLGVPDMRVPIQYALTYPARLPCAVPRLSLKDIGQMSFYEPDDWAKPILELARHAAAEKGSAGAILNGANEAAVALFLSEKIPFYAIAQTVQDAIAQVPAKREVSLDDLLEADRAAREAVSALQIQ